MSGYITTSYFADRFGLANLRTIMPTVDLTGAPSPTYPNFVVDYPKLERLIEYASRIIDDYIAGRISTPIIGTVPGLIQDICYHITAEMCYTTPDKPLEITENRKSAIETLMKIHGGTLSIDGTAISGAEVIQPYELEERGQYDDSYNEDAGVGITMGDF